jgi:RimJ/RimL family protein N-acetyltransferase
MSSGRSVPTLTTSRLRLVPVAEQDVDQLHKLWTDPFVRRYLWDDRVIARARAREVVLDAIASARERGLPMWIVQAHGADELIGFCGFRVIPGTGEVELLYALRQEHTGKGLATEAARTAIEWLFAAHPLARVIAGTDPPNLASFRVMERLGMRRLPRPVEPLPGVIYYELPRGEASAGGGSPSGRATD